MTETEGKVLLDTFFRLLFILMIILGVLRIFDLGFIYGSQSVFPNYPYEQGSALDLFLILSRHGDWLVYFEVAMFACLLISLFKQHWLPACLIYFIQMNLYYKGSIALDSGYMLLNICLLMNALRQLLALNRLYEDTVNNAVLLLLKCQVCLIYVVSFLYKTEGYGWMEGTALKELSGNMVFGGELMMALPDWLLTIGTFAVLIHQAIFSVLVWIEKTRKFTLIFGVFVHLGIIVFMGLFDFGLIMIMMYLLFVRRVELNFLKQKLAFRHKKSSPIDEAA